MADFSFCVRVPWRQSYGTLSWRGSVAEPVRVADPCPASLSGFQPPWDGTGLFAQPDAAVSNRRDCEDTGQLCTGGQATDPRLGG